MSSSSGWELNLLCYINMWGDFAYFHESGLVMQKMRCRDLLLETVLCRACFVDWRVA
jgi:hypothetical protein